MRLVKFPNCLFVVYYTEADRGSRDNPGREVSQWDGTNDCRSDEVLGWDGEPPQCLCGRRGAYLHLLDDSNLTFDQEHP